MRHKAGEYRLRTCTVGIANFIVSYLVSFMVPFSNAEIRIESEFTLA